MATIAEFEAARKLAGQAALKYKEGKPVSEEEKKALTTIRALKNEVWALKPKDASIRVDIRKYVPHDMSVEEGYINHLRLIVGFAVAKTVKADVATALKSKDKVLRWGMAKEASKLKPKKVEKKPVAKPAKK